VKFLQFLGDLWQKLSSIYDQVFGDGGENLVRLLEMAGKENGVPTPVFIGTDGLSSPPPGWHPFLAGMRFEQAVGRQVALVTDLSGSMNREVTKDYPQLIDKTLPDPSKTRKIDIAYRIAKHLHAGLQQRNVNGVLLPVKHRYRYVDGEAHGDPSGKGQDGVACGLEDYCAGSPVHHHWEGGPHLVAIRRLVENEKLPISDVFMVWDCDDITGDGFQQYSKLPRAPHDFLMEEQIKAAKWLVEEKGVRLHIVSIGGDLHPDVPEFIRKTVILKFPEMKSLDDLLGRVEKHMFENVLPRLSVMTEPEGMKPLPQAKTEALTRAAANPDLRLINMLHKYVDRADDPRKADILLWGGHFSPAGAGLGSPLFMRGRYQTSEGNRDAYWLMLDLRAEMAKALSGQVGQKQRDALGDLLIASVNAVTDSLNRPPGVWQVDPTGQLRAMARDRRPFNLHEVEAKLRAAGGKAGGRRPAAHAPVDLRRPPLPGPAAGGEPGGRGEAGGP
jgi:hypothetical protein